MNLVIHDLEQEELLSSIFPTLGDDIKIISDDGTIKHCIGCFGCWIKTPAVCVIRDNYGDMGEYLSKCKTLTIISKCFYGGYSPFIKNVMDRSISYVHPYFEIRNKEIHHKNRYDTHFDLKVLFYGENISDKEKETAKKLVKANSTNLDCKSHEVSFVTNLAEMEGLSI